MRQILVLAAALGFCAPAEGQQAYLYQPAFAIDEVLRLPAEEYTPQPGDIMLRLDPSRFWRVTHHLALAFDPNGSAIIVPRRDGSLAVLEAGPNDTLWTRRMELFPHLKGYHDVGRVWIRRRKTPLTEDQCRRLMEFGEAVDGKRFALIRLGGQLTPLRSRGPLRTYFMGHPRGIKASYFCSECEAEACVYSGLLSAARTRPSAMYPNDIFYGRSINPFIDANLDVNCAWHPPARWTCSPVKPCP